MRAMPAEQVAVLSSVICVMLIALLAVALPIAAAFLPSRRRGLLTVALCLWCVLAGYTLSGYQWAWMADTNLQYVQSQLAAMPPETRARDVEPYTMSMLVFFLRLDHLGRKFLYATVAVPLLLCIAAWRKAQAAPIGKPPGMDQTDPFIRE